MDLTRKTAEENSHHRLKFYFAQLSSCYFQGSLTSGEEFPKDCHNLSQPQSRTGITGIWSLVPTLNRAEVTGGSSDQKKVLKHVGSFKSVMVEK